MWAGIGLGIGISLLVWFVSARLCAHRSHLEKITGYHADRGYLSDSGDGSANRATRVDRPCEERISRYVAWLEKQELARGEMHDRVRAAVSEAAGAVEQIAENAGSDANLQMLLDGTVDRLRQMLNELRAERSFLGHVHLDGLDLRVGLVAMSEELARTGLMTVDSQIDTTVSGILAPATAVHVLWTVREALDNVVRHSEATRASVRASVENRRLVVRIADDGRGFDHKRPPADHGRGLDRMQLRTEAARGVLQVESAQGAGTIVTIMLPVCISPVAS